jgi:hypothetical protein
MWTYSVHLNNRKVNKYGGGHHILINEYLRKQGSRCIPIYFIKWTLYTEPMAAESATQYNMMSRMATYGTRKSMLLGVVSLFIL